MATLLHKKGTPTVSEQMAWFSFSVKHTCTTDPNVGVEGHITQREVNNVIQGHQDFQGPIRPILFFSTNTHSPQPLGNLQQKTTPKGLLNAHSLNKDLFLWMFHPVIQKKRLKCE